MNDELKVGAQIIAPASRQTNTKQDAIHCTPTAEGHCITCSDEALPVRVLHIDAESGLALVEVKGTTEEIDITLVDDVVPGDLLLAHGGVALGRPDEAKDE
jgi:hydrogenase maturation factor